MEAIRLAFGCIVDRVACDDRKWTHLVGESLAQRVEIQRLSISLGSKRGHKTTRYSIVARPDVAALMGKLGDGG